MMSFCINFVQHDGCCRKRGMIALVVNLFLLMPAIAFLVVPPLSTIHLQRFPQKQQQQQRQCYNNYLYQQQSILSQRECCWPMYHYSVTAPPTFVSRARSNTTTATTINASITTNSSSSPSRSSSIATSHKKKSPVWDKMIKRLQKFHEIHGHGLVTADHDDPELYKWTVVLRKNYGQQMRKNKAEKFFNNGKRQKKLSPEKVRALKDLGFVWAPQSPWTSSWMQRYKELRAFKKKYGHCRIPMSRSIKKVANIKVKSFNPKLASWVKYQRRQYKQIMNGEKSALTPDRIKLLNDIGFEWSSSKSNSTTMYQHTKLFQSNSTFSSSSSLSSSRLSSKTTFRKSKTPVWDRMIKRLQKFHETHGHSRVKNSHGDPELYKWTSNLRINYRHQVQNNSNIDNDGIIKSKSSNTKRPKLPPEKLQVLNDLGFWNPESTWTQRYEELCKFKQKYGDCLVPTYRSIKYGHYEGMEDVSLKLATWVQNQRRQYQLLMNGERSALTPDQIKLLNEIGFEWSPSKNNGTNRKRRRKLYRSSSRVKSRKVKTPVWDKMIIRLRKFYEQHGHTQVSKEYNEPELRRWAYNVRNNYRHQVTNNNSTRRQNLPPEKLQILEELGFWDPNALWMQRYEELCEFKQKHGHCQARLFRSIVYNNGDGAINGLDLKLLHWVQNQRREYCRLMDGKRSRLSLERLQALNEIDFDWPQSLNSVWEKRYNELKDFHNLFNHSNVPIDYLPNYPLGQWCMNQRTRYKLYANGEPSGLTSERVNKLRELNFQWNVHEYKWNVMYERLEDFHKEHGHLNVTSTYPVDEELRSWISAQRCNYNRRDVDDETTGLSEERIKRLEAVPGWLWKHQFKRNGPTDEEWEALFSAIRAKGIYPGMKPKSHWFEGLNPNEDEVKTDYTDEDIMNLWNADDN